MARFLAFFTLFHLSFTFFRPEVPFKCFLQNVINIEKKIAVKNNALRIHCKKVELSFLYTVVKNQQALFYILQ